MATKKFKREKGVKGAFLRAELWENSEKNKEVVERGEERSFSGSSTPVSTGFELPEKESERLKRREKERKGF